MDGINVAESWQVKPVVADLIIGAWTKPISGMDGEDGFLLAADGKRLRLILRHLCIRVGNVKEIN